MQYENRSLRIGDVKGLIGFSEYDKKVQYQKLIIGDPAKAVAISHEQLKAETGMNNKFPPMDFTGGVGAGVSDAMRLRFESQMPEDIK